MGPPFRGEDEDEDAEDEDTEHEDELPPLTLEQLGRFRGENGGPVYVAVDGKVFDVSESRAMYGPGGSYHVFAGRDATRALAMGSTREEDVLARPGDVAGLSTSQLVALDAWLDRLEGKYPVVAVLVPWPRTPDPDGKRPSKL